MKNQELQDGRIEELQDGRIEGLQEAFEGKTPPLPFLQFCNPAILPSDASWGHQ